MSARGVYKKAVQNPEKHSGKMIISLDFELLWGVFDHATKESYHCNISGGRQAIPEILALFESYQIHASWGVVGLLLAENRQEAYNYAPTQKPSYMNPALSAYETFSDLGDDEQDDPYHYAKSLVDRIRSCEHQEICSHTFAHYYCTAVGQTTEQFKADLQASKSILFEKISVSPISLILPRNQFKKEYAEIARQCGFRAIRGNQTLYCDNHRSILARGIRLLDSYVNITGNRCYSEEDICNDGICNIMASRFFRPYSHKLRCFEKLKIARIKGQMRYAAKHNKVFHLWWHPHNFGKYPEQCLSQLEEILKYYISLKQEFEFESLNMQELSNRIME